MQVNDRVTYMTPERECLTKINRKGFTQQFAVEGTFLLCVDDNQRFRPEEVEVVNFYRFEGISDPDDMSVIYVLKTMDGHKGSLIDAYGIYANVALSDFMQRVNNIQKQTRRGWR